MAVTRGPEWPRDKRVRRKKEFSLSEEAHRALEELGGGPGLASQVVDELLRAALDPHVAAALARWRRAQREESGE